MTGSTVINSRGGKRGGKGAGAIFKTYPAKRKEHPGTVPAVQVGTKWRPSKGNELSLLYPPSDDGQRKAIDL